MKLIASINDTHCVFSVARYDFRSYGEGNQYIMADGGQPFMRDYGGYTRFSGKRAVIELPDVNFAQLYSDYFYNNTASKDVRKYGIHKLEDVEICHSNLDFQSKEWVMDNSIYRTTDGEYKMIMEEEYDSMKDVIKKHLKLEYYDLNGVDDDIVKSDFLNYKLLKNEQ